MPNQYIELVVQSSFGTPEPDVISLEEFIPGNIAVFVGTLIFDNIDCGEKFANLSVLPCFLMHIQKHHDSSMPFHNAIHAADVLHTLFVMLRSTSLGRYRLIADVVVRKLP